MNQPNAGETLPPKERPRFCIDCRYIDNFTGRYPLCRAPASELVNLVTGFYAPTCDQARRPSGTCGRSAVNFEAPAPVNPANRSSESESAAAPAIRAPYARHSASSESKRSSFCMSNQDSVDSCSTTVATTDAGTSLPSTDEQIALAVTIRS